MDFLSRLLVVLILISPIATGGCVDVLDREDLDAAEADVGVDASVEDVEDEEAPQTWDEFMSGADWGLDEEISVEEAGTESDLSGSDGLGDGDEDDADEMAEIDEGEVVALEDVEMASRAQLFVDPDASDVEIRRISVKEGSDAHYLSVLCHDDEVGSRRWRRYSDRCDVDLASAARAIRIEPSLGFRIAPTPRGFRIIGDFEQGEYEIEIAAGLRTDDGAYLKQTHEETVEIPELSPSLSFRADGRYLPRSAWNDLSFHHRNIDDLRLQVHHVPEENLPFWISSNSDNANQRTANRVVNTEVNLPNEPDETLVSSISIDRYIGDPQPGLYQIQIRSGRETATTRLQVTDMNLITKRHESDPGKRWEEHIDVWAVDMESTESMGGVDVEAIRPSGATMARCRTNYTGHCRLELTQDTTDPAPPMGLIARRGDDLTYLKFDEVRIEDGVQEVGGPAYREEQSYLATLYGDRDLYRPGDDFHLVGVLRDIDFRAADESIPVELTVIDPEGKTVVERNEETDAAGSFGLSFPLSEVAPTGRWRAELEVGKRILETYSFYVEEFVPERLEVSARPTRDYFLADQEATFEVSARYLFGASAQGSEVELKCRMVPIDSPATEGSDYAYGPMEIDESRSVIDLSSRTAIIDEEDRAEVGCPKPEQRLRGPMRVEATISVAEGGSGRTTNAAADGLIYPAAYEIGLQADVDDVSAGDRVKFSGHIVDIDGELSNDVDDTMTLEFYDVRRHRSWRRHRSTGRYRVHNDYELMLERAVDVDVEDGKFEVETTAANVSYAYLIRARMGDARTDMQLSRRGRFWRWSGRTDSTPQARRPTEVNIEAPSEAAIGYPTEIEFTAPFSGRALVTVETDEVIDMEWIDAEEGRNEWSFIADGDEPNVYVGVFLIRDPREVSPDAFIPERAFGAISIPVERSQIEARVSMDIPEEVRPGETLSVEVDTGIRAQNTMATIAAVDEGILQLTGYQTPDPLDAMWTERSLGVRTFDTIGWATRLPPMNPSSRTGGGAGDPGQQEASEGRIMPFEPVALWSGPIEVGDDGLARVEFEVPTYSGRLRVMTSVFGAEEMGATQQDVLVRDPLTVQTTFPRHLTDHDEAKIPVFLTNLTGEFQTVEVEISAQARDLPGYSLAADGSHLPVIEFLDGSTQTVELDADESTTLYFTAQAARPGGAADVTVEARSLQYSSIDEGTIPFRPRGPTERRVEVVSLNNDTANLAEGLDGWVPTTEETTFFASALPEPRAFDHLERLVRYPHGCAEQTLSTARPLVFIPDLVEGLDPVTVDEGGGIHSMVEHGISRILSMQRSSGGFAYWPNAYSVARSWVTAHALHFLMDARNQGYHVPDDRIESAAEWLGDNINSRRRMAYQHYVLALAGEAKTQDIRKAIDDLPDTPSGRARENAYLLKAALYLSGDRSFAEDLRNPRLDLDEENGRSTGRGFYSHRRQRAMMLGVYVELFGRDQSEAGARRLVDAVTRDMTNGGRRGLTTQEMAWALMGLGQWYDMENADDVQVALHVDGQEVQTQPLANSYGSWSVRGASEFDDVSVHVERGDYDGELSMLMRSRGVRHIPTQDGGGAGLQVERTYLDAGGEEIESAEITLGEVIYAHVRLKNTSGDSLENLALVDRLPAGLEVENPNLGAAELPNWAEESWETDHVNVRDDRVEMFGGLRRRGEVEMVYPVRATISGQFYAAPVEVEAMYDPDIWARDEAGEIRIGAPASELID